MNASKGILDNYNKFFRNAKVLRNPNQFFTNLQPSFINREILSNIVKGHPLCLNNINMDDNESINEMKHNLLTVSDKYLRNFGSVGSYTDSLGTKFCLENILRAMNKRDHITDEVANEHIALDVDYSTMFDNLTSLCVKDKTTCIFLPKPVDPLYTLYSNNRGSSVRYETDIMNFNTTLENIKKQLESLDEKIESKILFISNPNTFFGKVLTEKEIKKCLDFCYSNRFMLLVDESFQQTTKSDFVSFRKVLYNHDNTDLKNNLELMTFYDPVKGIFPEASLQGCIVTLNNFDDFVLEMYVKLRSIMLCSSALSQINSDLNFSLYYDDSLLSKHSFNLHQQEIERNKENINLVENNIIESLKNLDNIELYESDGGFSIWAKIHGSQYFEDKNKENLDIQVASNILKNAKINCQAGSIFDFPGYLRFSKLSQIEDCQYDILRETISLFKD